MRSLPSVALEALAGFAQQFRCHSQITLGGGDMHVPSVHGERKIEKEEKEENFRRVERQYGSFTRSFTLPSSVDLGK